MIKLEKPFFSIVTVCLNSGIELLNTIISVLKQDFTSFEIIIKDGGSQDGSLESLPNDSRLKIHSLKDSGIYDAMNQALNYVNGDYVLFLNTADYFTNDYVLSDFKKEINVNKFPDLVYCNYKTTKHNFAIIAPARLNSRFLFRTMLCHQTCMIKATNYSNNNNFDTDLKVVADYDFLLRLLIGKSGTYCHLNKLCIISTSGGYSAQNYQLGLKEVSKLRKKYFRNKYRLYIFLYSLTMPWLRNKVAASNSYFAIYYFRIINRFNRL